MASQLLARILRPAVQHGRVRATAPIILAVRWLEGLAAWMILFGYYAPHTVDPFFLHLDFLAYGLANLALYRPQIRQTMTAPIVWFDIVANLFPMALAAHWSGGVYSPLLPIFVVKISSYGLLYGTQVQVSSLVTTMALGAAMALGDRLGVIPTPSIENVPMLIHMRFTFVFEALAFGILVGGSLRSFSLLQQRDRRLAELVRESSRLYRESLEHQSNLRELSRSMMESSEATMRHLVRELHDDLGQGLTAVRMDLGLLDRQLPSDSPLRARVLEARNQIAAVLQSMRNLSQLLRPPALDDLGLVPALQWYVERFRERTGIAVSLETAGTETERVPQAIEVAVYRVVQEALTNVSRHADAKQVRVNLILSTTSLSLTIADDGIGFDSRSYFARPSVNRGIGLFGMRERVATCGGTFDVTSSPGGGTVVAVSIPLALSEAG